MSRKEIIQRAAAEEGTTENPPNSNKTKYGEWYGLNGVPWCAIFVSYIFDKAGHSLGFIETGKGYQSCQGGYNHWRSTNEFTTNPQPGDIVLYDWNGDGHCDHTGIFLRWIKQGEKFEAWEGNTSMTDNSNGGIVMLRKRSANVVRAFVSPAVLGGMTDQIIHNDLAAGDRGSRISDLQHKLSELGYKIVIDGWFGKETEIAVKRFQEENHLEATGIVSEALIGYMTDILNRPRVSDKKLISGSFLKKGDRGFAVLSLQKKLNAFGANFDFPEFRDALTIALHNVMQSQKDKFKIGGANPISEEQLLDKFCFLNAKSFLENHLPTQI